MGAIPSRAVRVSPTSEPSRFNPQRFQSAPEHAPTYVSVVNELPEDLYNAMREFVRTHPQWDQYRLMQASLAGFLFQHGSTDRAVSRHYLNGLFRREGGPQAPEASPGLHPTRPESSMVQPLIPSQRLQQDRPWPSAA
jgi:hypothetical protein